MIEVQNGKLIANQIPELLPTGRRLALQIIGIDAIAVVPMLRGMA